MNPKDTATQQFERKLLLLVANFLKELGAERALRSLSVDASIQQDLGIDSLGKVELISRINQQFKIQLPEQVVATAETIKDLLTAIMAANPAIRYKKNEFSPQISQSTIAFEQATNIVDLFYEYAEKTPDRPHIYFRQEDGFEHIISYSELCKRANAFAVGLQQKGIEYGSKVAIMLPTCEDFFTAFMGAFFAGCVPIAIYPPYQSHLIEEYVRRESKILQNAEAKVLITFDKADTLGKIIKSFVPCLQLVSQVKPLMIEGAFVKRTLINADDIALIQYTSGSTGNPKGIQLQHKHIMNNITAAYKRVSNCLTDSYVSWLPLYHDMGLASWLGMIIFGVPFTIMTPWAFLSRPENWLWAIHYHQATHSAGPNFSYELCIKKITPESIEGLDLSSWKVGFNGAEAVQANTIKNFYKKFAPYGLKQTVISPAYGLAESTVALTLPKTPRVPIIDKVKTDAFETHNRAVPATKDDKKYLEFVGVGEVIEGQEIRIVDDSNEVLPDRTIGSIQFRGTSAMLGYYNNPEATNAAFHDGWWDTGDYGYMVNKELYITGRKKDLIIKAGRNLVPEEIEDLANQVAGIRKGCTVAFGITDVFTATEKLVIVCETRETDKTKLKEMQQNVRTKVLGMKDIAADEVTLTHPGGVLKTSSGKLMRAATKKAYIDGVLTKKHHSVQWQIIKLGLSSAKSLLLSGIKGMAKVFYSTYLYVLVFLVMAPTWVLLWFLPHTTARAMLKCAAKLIMLLSFCRTCVLNKNTKAFDSSVIYIANHCSYIDAFVLLAYLPSNIIYVAKKELLKTPMIGSFIKKLKYLTVDRNNFNASIHDAEQIKQAIEKKRSIVIFPEGTFTASPGLRSFKLGAFKLAVDTATPLVPIAICGTRKVLRNNDKLFMPNKIKLTINTPIIPAGNSWNDVMAIKNLSRQIIAQDCGEPMLDVIVAGPET